MPLSESCFRVDLPRIHGKGFGQSITGQKFLDVFQGISNVLQEFWVTKKYEVPLDFAFSCYFMISNMRLYPLFET